MTGNGKYFIRAIIMTIFLSIVIFIASAIIGKEKIFLFLNHDFGITGDWLFTLFSKIGEGWLWIPVAIWLLWKKKWQLLVFSVCCVVISTALVQGGKNLFFSENVRPYFSVENKDEVHIVKWEKPHRAKSFPSGHTSLAFTFYLFIILLLGYWWMIAGFFLALSVGYSRIYLAQHFPMDIAGGMFCAGLAAVISYFLVKKYFAKLP